jgi:hypothetical protein
MKPYGGLPKTCQGIVAGTIERLVEATQHGPQTRCEQPAAQERHEFREGCERPYGYHGQEANNYM